MPDTSMITRPELLEAGLLLICTGLSVFLVFNLAMGHLLRASSVSARRIDDPSNPGWMLMFPLDGFIGQASRLVQVTAIDQRAALNALRGQVASGFLLAGLVVIASAHVARRRTLGRWELALLVLCWGAAAGAVVGVHEAVIVPKLVEGRFGAVYWAVHAPLWAMGVLVPFAAAFVHAIVTIARAHQVPREERIALTVPLGLFCAAGTLEIGSAVWSQPALSGYFPYAFAVLALALGWLDRTRLQGIELRLARQTAMLHEQNAQLDRALGEATAAKETRARFIANVSHELRTPINGILGLASLLEDTRMDVHQRELVGHLSASGRALRVLIDDILDFSKIDAGKVKLEVMEFDPRLVVSEVVGTLAHPAYEKGIGLEARISKEVPARIRGDAQRLRQIVLNLVGNAVKFTSDGAVTVSLYSRSADDHLWLYCDVSDTGIGIEVERLPRLFDPFVQGEQGPARAYPGSGLGLAISRELARAMDGDIVAESTVAVGSVFRLHLRMALVPDVAPWKLPLPAGQRVLVLDWDGLLRFAIEPLLESCAAQVSWRRSISEVEPDARFDVIMDGALALPMQIDALRTRTGARWIAFPRLDDRTDWPRGCAPDAIVYRPIIPERLAEVLRARPAAPDARVVDEPAGLSVLVVDDNPVNRLVACRLVESLGSHAVPAHDGLAALREVDAREVRVILMDCQMPGMDGYETTRRIRARHGNRHLIYALTANAMEQDRQRAFESGMDGYLVKPVDRELLARTLDEARAARSAAVPAA